ncbi:leukocyte elastase inhibitor-like [Pristis pectinata]|uniref:leukocyte elastase inhibitor-like n=1 Tax=Pristis pectinata TaxID=685728 RepID=UPI00223E4120|nr:leukocyte elastase inhibitor-like [Pristis pectinata]
MDSLIAANTNFAFDLYTKLKEETKNENIFLSPLSVSVALSMAYLGARGNTADQMAKVLHFDTERDVHARVKELMAKINKPDASYLLRLANRMYGEETFNILREFQNSSLNYYKAELAAVSFLKHSEAVRNEINTYVENKTEGKIKDLLPEDAITPLTVLVLVNAIYFKGKWNSKFNEKDTYVTKFKMNKNESKTVHMMSQEENFNFSYIAELKTSVLELPYEQKELSMIILLPDDISENTTGLEQLEKALANNTLLKWINLENMMQKKVTVHLPRFKLEDQFNLEDKLSAMGMIDAFDQSRANFSGISEKNNLSLSKVIHKSFVEVNEEGTEAAAATAIPMNRTSYQIPQKFVADHPFLFFIKHNKTQSILFFGRYSSPVDEAVGSGASGNMIQQVQSRTQIKQEWRQVNF